MNYRRFYEYHTGKKIPKEHQIHHLDFNRNNNTIENLVSIPATLHRKFHRIHLKFTKAVFELNSCRYFNKRPTETLLDNIRQYTLVRSELYSYESIKETDIYLYGRR